MPRQEMRKKYGYTCIASNAELNRNLALIREKTGKSNIQIISEILNQLSEILVNYPDGKYYVCPLPDGQGLEIRCYSLKNRGFVMSGKLTASLDETLIGLD